MAQLQTTFHARSNDRVRFANSSEFFWLSAGHGPEHDAPGVTIHFASAEQVRAKQLEARA